MAKFERVEDLEKTFQRHHQLAKHAIEELFETLHWLRERNLELRAENLELRNKLRGQNDET